MPDGLRLRATARVTITKQDENGNVLGVETHDVELTEEEAKAIWDSQMQE